MAAPGSLQPEACAAIKSPLETLAAAGSASGPWCEVHKMRMGSSAQPTPTCLMPGDFWITVGTVMRSKENYRGRVRQKGARTERAADRDRPPDRAASEGRGRLPHDAGNLDVRGLAGRRAVRAFENRAKARASRFRVFEPASEREKARVFLAFALRPDGQSGRSCKLAGGLGFEPRLAESESA